MESVLKAPGTKRYKLTYGGLLSNFAFKFNLRRFTLVTASAATRYVARLRPSDGETGLPQFLEIEGLFTQGSRPGRTSGESIGGIFEMDTSDWSHGTTSIPET